MKVAILTVWGALSEERTGLSFVRVSHLSVYTLYLQIQTYLLMNVQYIQGLCQPRLSTANCALFLRSSLRYNGSLIT
jgi:hypothetical protein